ncbi:hypothetical protein ANO11243_018500 [Dothideomycetidae sp. 11243]|nr:hypothetical protein ANO11243_018500 [fungal sp. No.11243]
MPSLKNLFHRRSLDTAERPSTESTAPAAGRPSNDSDVRVLSAIVDSNEQGNPSASPPRQLRSSRKHESVPSTCQPIDLVRNLDRKTISANDNIATADTRDNGGASLSHVQRDLEQLDLDGEQSKAERRADNSRAAPVSANFAGDQPGYDQNGTSHEWKHRHHASDSSTGQRYEQRIHDKRDGSAPVSPVSDLNASEGRNRHDDLVGRHARGTEQQAQRQSPREQDSLRRDVPAQEPERQLSIRRKPVGDGASDDSVYEDPETTTSLDTPAAGPRHDANGRPYAVYDAREAPSLEGIVDLTNTTDTTVHETWQPGKLDCLSHAIFD